LKRPTCCFDFTNIDLDLVGVGAKWNTKIKRYQFAGVDPD
jgi:hypothetical protein